MTSIERALKEQNSEDNKKLFKEMNNFKNQSIISIDQFSREDFEYIFKITDKIRKGKYQALLSGKILGNLFFEPSTRTRLSFESAMKHLGGEVVGFAIAGVSSAAKGETVADCITMVEKYADVIVMRHPLEGSAKVASETTDKPIINGGDGTNQHPTQTLLDLYTIAETQKKIEGLNVAMVGDLKYGRTVHSLAKALSLFGCKLSFVAPESLAMPDEILEHLTKHKIEYSCHLKIEEVVKEADIIYMTRIQKERFPDPLDYEQVKGVYVLSKKDLKGAKSNLRIMHPLPRVDEIAQDVDSTKYAYYFQQAENGLHTRKALLSLVLGQIK